MTITISARGINISISVTDITTMQTGRAANALGTSGNLRFIDGACNIDCAHRCGISTICAIGSY